MKSQTKNKLTVTCIALVSALGAAVAYRLGIGSATKDLINLADNGDGPMIIEDKKTGLIYEVKSECIGD